MQYFCGVEIGVKYYNGNIQAVQRGSVKELQQLFGKYSSWLGMVLVCNAFREIMRGRIKSDVSVPLLHVRKL